MYYDVLKPFEGNIFYEAGERIEIDENDTKNWRNLQLLLNCGYLRPVNLVQI